MQRKRRRMTKVKRNPSKNQQMNPQRKENQAAVELQLVRNWAEVEPEPGGQTHQMIRYSFYVLFIYIMILLSIYISIYSVIYLQILISINLSIYPCTCLIDIVYLSVYVYCMYISLSYLLCVCLSLYMYAFNLFKLSINLGNQAY